jgi:hypothetical protein
LLLPDLFLQARFFIDLARCGGNAASSSSEEKASMANKKSLIAFWFLWAWVVSVSGAGAAVQLDSLTVGYCSFSGHYTPVWIAVEDRLGRKYGLDLKVVYAGRMRPSSSLSAARFRLSSRDRQRRFNVPHSWRQGSGDRGEFYR